MLTAHWSMTPHAAHPAPGAGSSPLHKVLLDILLAPAGHSSCSGHTQPGAAQHPSPAPRVSPDKAPLTPGQKVPWAGAAVGKLQSHPVSEPALEAESCSLG